MSEKLVTAAYRNGYDADFERVQWHQIEIFGGFFCWGTLRIER